MKSHFGKNISGRIIRNRIVQFNFCAFPQPGSEAAFRVAHCDAGMLCRQGFSVVAIQT